MTKTRTCRSTVPRSEICSICSVSTGITIETRALRTALASTGRRPGTWSAFVFFWNKWELTVFEFVERAGPVFAEEAAEGAVGEEFAAGLAARAIVGFVGSVADALDP